MLKIVSTLALFVALILFPPTGLILISQDAVKGDRMYPVKRSLENGVAFIVSLTPYTRAYFAVALANRRYEEVAILLGNNENADSTLQELVVQAGEAASNINEVGNSNQKVRLITDLTTSIDRYEKGLSEAQQEIGKRSAINIALKRQQQPGAGQSAVPTPEPSPSVLTSTPQPSQTSVSRTDPSPAPEGEIEDDKEAKKRQRAIEKARKELEELKRKLEEEKRLLQLQNNNHQSNQDQPQPSPSPTPSPSFIPSASPSVAPSPSVKASSNSTRLRGQHEKEEQKKKQESNSDENNEEEDD